MVQHLWVTYNDIHNLIRESTPEIARSFNPDLLIAIGTRSLSSPVTDNSIFNVQAEGQLYLPTGRALAHINLFCRGFFPARVMVRLSNLLSVNLIVMVGL